MDEAYAFTMREEGFSYRAIGAELAKREGRSVPYQAPAVLAAVKRFRELLDED